ncbi:hypothetical protein WJX72_008135 [[Myrmecia] bisecta]|uniref:Uncharacterized protein n=1 Tax=[Myrmecia] bisecta TaxID=41462 RepID=A0AAW1QRR1_9CHLO
MQWIASHERDVTRMHYLTLATDAMHRMDLPLKLAKYGDRYRAQLPAAVHAVESHRDWPAFRGLVLQQDQKSKLWAAVNRAFSGNPVAVLQHLRAGSSTQAPSCAVDQDTAPARTCSTAKQVATFGLCGFDTVEQAVAASAGRRDVTRSLSDTPQHG